MIKQERNFRVKKRPGFFTRPLSAVEPRQNDVLLVFIPAQNRVLRTRLPVQLKAPACFWLFGLWPKIQATRFTG